jgi:hypothetical protein
MKKVKDPDKIVAPVKKNKKILLHRIKSIKNLYEYSYFNINNNSAPKWHKKTANGT